MQKAPEGVLKSLVCDSISSQVPAAFPCLAARFSSGFKIPSFLSTNFPFTCLAEPGFGHLHLKRVLNNKTSKLQMNT